MGPVGLRRCAVLGSPIAHSLSPVLHRAAYAELGLPWEYDTREVREDDLAGFLDGLDETWRGLSLTMPLKRVVVPLLDEMSEWAAQAQAANTVILEDGRRHGHNTDIPGAQAAIRERYEDPLGAAVVLGGGATAASMLLALADLGCPSATLVVRDVGRAADTLAIVERHPAGLDVRVRGFGGLVGAAELLVSTVPAEAQTEDVLDLARAAEVVFDVVYDPWPTPLVRTAREAGRVLVSGLDLLLHQAALQVELMTEQPAPLGAMRAALQEAVRGSAGK